MLGIDDLVEVALGGTGWGVAVLATGAAVAIVGPRAKPLAKYAIKGYFAATHRVREVAAEAREQVQDLYAEAKYEYESQLEAAPAVVVAAEVLQPAEAPTRAPRGAARVEEQPA